MTTCVIANTDLIETFAGMVKEGGPFALAIFFLVLAGVATMRYIIRPGARIIREDVLEPIGLIEDKRGVILEKENDRLRVSRDIADTQLKIADIQKATAELYSKNTKRSA